MGLRFLLCFESDGGRVYEVRIYDRDYNGEALQRALGGAPVLKMEDGDAIRGTSLELRIEALGDGDLTVLYTTDNKRFRVELAQDGKVCWQGYVLPELYGEPRVAAPYDVAVTASDGLGVLKDVDFEMAGGKPEMLHAILQYCLDRTGLELEMRVSSTLAAAGMADTGTVLEQASVDPEMFAGDSCYEVVEKLMSGLGAFVTERGNVWEVARYTDFGGKWHVLNRAGEMRRLKDKAVKSLGQLYVAETYPIGGNLEMEVEPARKSLTVKQPYVLRESFLNNPGFDDGGEHWTTEGPGVDFRVWEDAGYCALSAARNNQSASDPLNLISQGVDVDASEVPVSIAVEFAVVFGRVEALPELDDLQRYAELQIRLVSGGVTRYLAREGWRSEAGWIKMYTTLQEGKIYGWSRLERFWWPDSFDEFQITLADGIPSGGKLYVSVRNPYTDDSYTASGGTGGGIFHPDYPDMNKVYVRRVTVMHSVEGNPDLEVVMNAAASQKDDDLELAFVDVPFEENAGLVFLNGLRHAGTGAWTGAWSCAGITKAGSFSQVAASARASVSGVKKELVRGCIAWVDFDLLEDGETGKLLYAREYEWNLLEDEMEVTLCECVGAGEAEVAVAQGTRSSDAAKRTVRASSATESRAYNTAGSPDLTPRMIRELGSAEEVTENLAVEVDDGVSMSSKKVTLGQLGGLFWTKAELEAAGRYLVYLGEKIKAGDSDLWDGEAFEDWMDQPVRKKDDVQFKSVESEVFRTPGFAAGMTGAGVGTVDGAELHADKLLARKYIEVLSLVVSQMFWRGGRQVLSPAGLKVSRVEAVAGGWRLYMETEDGQKNEFTVGAQARCNNYGTSQRYWWRLVTAVGADYIEVSETDCDAGSVVPAVGDEVVQLGHRTDPHQQWAVMDSSFSDDAGRTIYAGIDSYDLSGKLVLREGVDPNDPGRIGLFLADGTEVSTAIGNLQDEIGGLGEGLRMDIVAEEGNLVVDGAYDGDLVATVWRRWNDITSTVSGWVWTRQSGTDSASLASDALWNEAHAGVKSGRINITGADIVTDTVKFVCDATVGSRTVRGIFNGQ